MSKKPHVSLRVACPLPIYEKISAYRHEARHETRSQAALALIASGLAALHKPPQLAADSPLNGATAPLRPKKLIPFAGKPGYGP